MHGETDRAAANDPETPRARVHLLVASDGSPVGAAAARRALALLAPAERITLLRVLTHVPDQDFVDDEDEDAPEPAYTPEQLAWHWSVELGAAQAELRSTADVIGRPGVDGRIEAGNVARTVCDVARELGVDAIIVGCHARSRLRRLFLRSVSEHIVREAPCAVMVVPVVADDAGAPAT
jgi:nucleotide-binding universal stress UspA family protein